MDNVEKCDGIIIFFIFSTGNSPAENSVQWLHNGHNYGVARWLCSHVSIACFTVNFSEKVGKSTKWGKMTQSLVGCDGE